MSKRKKQRLNAPDTSSSSTFTPWAKNSNKSLSSSSFVSECFASLDIFLKIFSFLPRHFVFAVRPVSKAWKQHDVFNETETFQPAVPPPGVNDLASRSLDDLRGHFQGWLAWTLQREALQHAVHTAHSQLIKGDAEEMLRAQKSAYDGWASLAPYRFPTFSTQGDDQWLLRMSGLAQAATEEDNRCKRLRARKDRCNTRPSAFFQARESNEFQLRVANNDCVGALAAKSTEE
eukprot:g75806.t1